MTDAIVAEVTAWQGRPLEPLYPVVFLEAQRAKIRDEAVVRSKAVYLALAVLPDGSRDLLGIWIELTEGAKFWMKIITTRGHCPNDEAATQLIWLALRNLIAKWDRTAYAWRTALTQFAICYGDRFRRPPA